METEVILEMQGMKKSFPGVKALDNVEIKLLKGEVLAIVGENGAGKSTLLKILSGAYTKDEGTITYDGEIIDNYTPDEAINFGISVIYQELDNYATLSVAENILVNALPRKGAWGPIDWKKTKNKSEEILGIISKDIDVSQPMSKLTAAQQQLVEIAKALSRNMKILVMDEPTSALNRVETEELLNIIKKLADSGISIIYISHRMDEVFSVSNHIQVMRDGKTVSYYKTEEVDEDTIIKDMVGRTLDAMYPHISLERGKKILSVKNLSCGKAKDVNFDLHEGEILGLFGLMGAGRTSVVKGIFGDHFINNGYIEIDDIRVDIKSPSDAIKHGIAYVPNERKLEGLMLTHSVKSNITISVLDKLIQNMKLDLNKEREISKKWIDLLNIKTPSTETLVESLSGGNQQKVIIARWLETTPRVLILNDPTRGIDIGAKSEIYGMMEKLCEQGIGIIMISSELKETLSMSDRILVMSEGKITGEVSVKDATQESLMKLAVLGME